MTSHAVSFLLGFVLACALGIVAHWSARREWDVRLTESDEMYDVACARADDAEEAARIAANNQALAFAQLRAVDDTLEKVYGAPLQDLVYLSRVDAIADLRRKGPPKLRTFMASAEMVAAAEEALQHGQRAASLEEDVVQVALADKIMDDVNTALAHVDVDPDAIRASGL